MDTSPHEVRDACLRLIGAHLANPALSQSWLATQLHISRRQLNRSFAGYPGTSEVIARWRLRAAMHVMRKQPDLPVEQVATVCGYSTYETFRSQARRLCGCTPGELRGLAIAGASAAPNNAVAEPGLFA